MIYQTSPSTKISGKIRVPGDKSISHRSIMLGALARGVTHIEGFLNGDDCLATLNAFQSMGVHIEGPVDNKVTIHGVGMQGLKAPKNELDLGNSGTGMRLLSGLMCGQMFDSTLLGDESLSQRPMTRVTTPLKQMGADIQGTETGTPPLHIKGDQSLKAISYDLPMASAQVKSCVLLAGLYAEGQTVVTEPAPTRDHTERMLRSFGYDVVTKGNQFSLQGGGELIATDIDVPADISSAAFFMVAGSIAQAGELTLQHVGMNPTRTGVIDILRLMGADIAVLNERSVGDEPVADLLIKPAPLKGIDIPEHLVPLAIDEFPVIFVAAALAEGQTRLTGAEELRVKESDRIQVMADGLIACGVDATPTPDGIVIQGGSMIKGATVDSHGDHRIAMAFAVAGSRAKGSIEILQCANVNTSFPGFAAMANEVGLGVVDQ